VASANIYPLPPRRDYRLYTDTENRPWKGDGMSEVKRAARVRRVLGAAFVALVVAGGAVAGPANAATLESFSGTGTGYALRVTLDVRPLIQAVPALQGVLDTVWAAVPGQSGAFPGVIDQTFIKTSSDAAADTTVARSVLAEGLIDLDSIEATKIGDNLSKVVQTVQLPSAGLPLIDGNVGSLKASVAKGPAINGSGALTSLGVGLPLDQLGNVTGLVDQLTSVVEELTADLDGVLNGALGGAAGDNLVGGLTDQITSLPTGSPLLGGIADGLGVPVAELDDEATVTGALDNVLDPAALLDELTGLLNTSLLEGALADLQGLINVTKAVRTGDALAVAESAATLKKLTVLGGLVDVGLFNLSSKSVAGGTPGSAKNTSSCSLADVKIGGDALGVSFDGKTIFLNGEPLPVAGNLVGTVKGLVDQVLNVLGISVGLCEVAQNEAEADGTAAAQRVSALRVKVAPLNLFSLVIDPTVETQAAAQLGAPVTPDKNVPLPRTGPAAIATIFSGIGLAGAALLARKRFLG
jgi:hypothetical protein